jgi:hypothetical protein
MDYLRWNDQIAVKFFNSGMVGRRVFLNVTAELINEVGNAENVRVPDFIRTVKTGPPWCSGVPLCDRAIEALAGWRRRKLDFPPYICFLALFVLAAGVGEEGEFASQAYYPRLRKLLGEEEAEKPYPHFSDMRLLWADLENWTQRDKDGKLGIFEYPTTGRFVNVGVPISQAILTEQERKLLPAIFADGGIDAGIPPAEPYLVSVLEQFGDGRLRPRTLRILDSLSTNRENYDVLVQTVRDEILHWDGSVTRVSEGGSKRTSVHGVLRLCCEDVDLTAGVMDLRLRCHARREFPEDGLTLSGGSRLSRYRCDEYAGGWSTCIEDFDTGEPLDPSTLDIFNGFSLRDVNHGWRFGLLRSGVRVFVSGALEGLSGHIEVQQLPTSSPFLLLAEASAWNLIERWGRSSCDDFRQLSITDGLPSSCRLYSAQRANTDNTVKAVYPNLALPSMEHIRLQGGIRFSGNTFFGFALPRVVVETSTPTFQVFCNGKALRQLECGDYALPSRVQKGGKLEIEVRNGDQVLAGKSIFVASEFPWQGVPIRAWFDFSGKLVKSDFLPRLAGATIVGSTVPPFEYWIGSEHAEIPTVQDDIHGPGESGLPVITVCEPPVDVGGLVREWRDETFGPEVSTCFGSRLSKLDGGNRLTEGAIHYRAGFCKNDPRSFNRAVQLFTELLKSGADPVVESMARGYQQLAFYRSKRLPKASAVDIPRLPEPFARLEAAMHGLATICGATGGASGWPDGLGFADISPLPEDYQLEFEIAMMMSKSRASAPEG